MKKIHKFLDKVVNIVDDMLYEVGLGDVVTIDWKYKKKQISLTHDRYGLIGTWNIEKDFETFHRLKNHYEDMKKSIYIRECIGFDIVKEVETFIQKYEMDYEEECDVYENPEIVDLSEEEDKDSDYYQIELDFSDEEDDEEDFCERNEEESPCPSYDDVDDFDMEDIFEETIEDNENTPEETRPKMEPIFEDIAVSYTTCPSCNSRNVRKNGKKRGIQRFICKDCNRYFSETTLQ